MFEAWNICAAYYDKGRFSAKWKEQLYRPRRNELRGIIIEIVEL